MINISLKIQNPIFPHFMTSSMFWMKEKKVKPQKGGKRISNEGNLNIIEYRELKYMWYQILNFIVPIIFTISLTQNSLLERK